MKRSSLQKSSVKTRLAIAMGAMFVPLLLLAGGVLFYFERGIDAFEKTENQSLEELFPLIDLEALIVENSASVKEYTISEDLAARDRFFQNSQEIDRAFAALLAMPYNLEQKQSLLKSSRREWQEALAIGQTIFNYPHPATNPRAVKDAERFYDLNFKAARNLDQLYKLLTHLQINENLIQAQNAKQQVRATVALAFVLGVGMATVTSTILIRSILQPLSILEEGVAHLGNGNFSHRIKLANLDELGQLAVAFNLMIQKLEQSQTALKNLATMDELTGVYNRREFNLQLKNELERSRRYGHCFALVLFDIDYFKKLNDTYGHQTGDLALRVIATLLKQEFRALDLVARYGGEEFIAVLPETSTSSAYVVAERIRQIISTHPISISAGKTISVTISGGLATFPADGDGAESLIYAADQSLYAAKRSGRNQIIVYGNLSTEKIS